MAINTSDCAAMLKAATQAKRQLMVGFNNRTNPTLQKLAKAVAAGKFGDILEARAQMYAAYATPPTSWRADKRRSGGWALGDIGTHLLDLVGWIMNSPPRAAQGHLTSRCWQLAIDDHAQVQILYQNGAVGSVTACTGAQGGPSRLEFFGSRGYFRLEGGLFAKPGTLEIAFTGKAPTHETLDAFDTYTAQISQFGAAVRGKPTLLASGADGATNIKLVSAARGW